MTEEIPKSTAEIEMMIGFDFISIADTRFKEAAANGIPLLDTRNNENEIIRLVSMKGDNVRSDYDILLERGVDDLQGTQLIIDFETGEKGTPRTFVYEVINGVLTSREIFSDVRPEATPQTLTDIQVEGVFGLLRNAVAIKFEDKTKKS
jgi:hypothetical protein